MTRQPAMGGDVRTAPAPVPDTNPQTNPDTIGGSDAVTGSDGGPQANVEPLAAAGTDQLVFVYGTLKRGGSNHGWLSGARPAGEAHLDGLVLHDLGPFPMAVLGDGRVWGELYAVDPEGLARLDALEGYPRLYDRRQMAVADGRQAWVYVGRPRQVRHAPIVSGGTWQASRNHQLDGGRDGDPAPTSTPNPPPSLL